MHRQRRPPYPVLQCVTSVMGCPGYKTIVYSQPPSQSADPCYLRSYLDIHTLSKWVDPQRTEFVEVNLRMVCHHGLLGLVGFCCNPTIPLYTCLPAAVPMAPCIPPLPCPAASAMLCILLRAATHVFLKQWCVWLVCKVCKVFGVCGWGNLC